MKKKLADSSPLTLNEADVIVIGSGLAGTAAACEAAGKGAQVILLEKMEYNGGNSALAGGGYACWDSGLKLRQKLGLGEDSWQLHMEDTIRAGKNLSNPALVEVLAKGAPSGLDWLVGIGVQFKDVLVKLGGYSAYRSYQAAISGKQMMDLAKAAAEHNGVHYAYGCTVTGFLREEDGPVIGVSWQQGNTNGVILARKGIVIASGGFSRDVEMRTAYCPELGVSYNCSNHFGATGEVIRSAQAIGAEVVDMDYIQLYPCANPVSGSVDRWAFYCYSGAGFGMLYVDGTGARFINELDRRDALADIQLSRCEKPTWAIMNQKIADQLGMTEKEISNGLRFNRMRSGNTIAALANDMGADAGILERTVRAHNEMIAGGGADEFGKTNNGSLTPMESGPFYAISQWPSVHYTMGGLRIDTKARVLDQDHRPIPRLFAAGEACGGVHGANRMGGNALAECVVFGRIAGQGAAAGEEETNRK